MSNLVIKTIGSADTKVGIIYLVALQEPTETRRFFFSTNERDEAEQFLADMKELENAAYARGVKDGVDRIRLLLGEILDASPKEIER
jgi:hypothetical protein